MNFVSAADFEREARTLLEDNTYISNGVERERDYETFHKQTDELMIRALRSLGYDAGLNIIEQVPRYYSKGD